MLEQIAINLIFALMWTFFHTPFTINDFLCGWLLGLIIVFFWQKQSSSYFYLRQLWDIIFLMLIFFREVFKSCLQVTRVVLTPGMKMRSGLITYETALTTPWHVVLLANMITITPGSFVIEISPDNRVFLIHVFNLTDAESFKREIRVYFEDNIRKVIR